MISSFRFAILFLAIAAGGLACAAPSDSEEAAINQVLINYRTAVNTNDEALFSSIILDADIPFFAVTAQTEPKGVAGSAETRDYESFRKGIFHSGEACEQTFDHIEITRHDGLAQASFHWVTRLKGHQEGGEGWKAVTLLKVKGQWKIASEFYTAGRLKA
jgi:hypothetical protein